jgi:hypothetical protein
MAAPIVIDSFDVRSSSSARNRVSALVDGRELWFESDLELISSPEPFLSAFLLPAMETGRDLVCESPVDAVWLKHMESLQDLFHSWWRYPKIRIEAPISPIVHTPMEKTAVLFSGGVDSFHTVLRHPRRIDALLFIEGLDIPISKQEYRAFACGHMQHIAGELGKDWLHLATNLREHPLFRNSHYTRTHGAALAAGAQLLRGYIGHLIINSSSVSDYDIPWGTHWDSDPLWSCSWLDIEHWGHHVWRAQKLVEIMREPMVRQHLRVCYHEFRVGKLNCGECEKCVRTMLSLHQQGQLESFHALQPVHGLTRSIDRVRRTKVASVIVYQGYGQQEQDPEIRRAIHRLIQRSQGSLSWIRRLVHKCRWRFAG